MANETDGEKGKTDVKGLDQGQRIERVIVAPDGTITIPQNEANLKSVDVADVDLLLSFSDDTFLIIPNGALDAMSAPPNQSFSMITRALWAIFLKWLVSATMLKP